jgi:hypothetical protein
MAARARPFPAADFLRESAAKTKWSFILAARGRKELPLVGEMRVQPASATKRHRQRRGEFSHWPRARAHTAKASLADARER